MKHMDAKGKQAKLKSPAELQARAPAPHRRAPRSRPARCPNTSQLPHIIRPISGGSPSLEATMAQTLLCSDQPNQRAPQSGFDVPEGRRVPALERRSCWM